MEQTGKDAKIYNNSSGMDPSHSYATYFLKKKETLKSAFLSCLSFLP